METKNLRRGTVVRAARDLDPQGARVLAGDTGVVFANCYGVLAGPIVQWFRQDAIESPVAAPQGGYLRAFRPGVVMAGVCNVYDGDVEVVREPDIAGIHTPPDVENSFAVARLLAHSWKDIDFVYEKLTDEERKLVSREEFDEIVAWVRRSP